MKPALPAREGAWHGRQREIEAGGRQSPWSQSVAAMLLPSGVILKASESMDMDLIILSTHRRAGLGAFWER